MAANNASANSVNNSFPSNTNLPYHRSVPTAEVWASALGLGETPKSCGCDVITTTVGQSTITISSASANAAMNASASGAGNALAAAVNPNANPNAIVNVSAANTAVSVNTANPIGAASNVNAVVTKEAMVNCLLPNSQNPTLSSVSSFNPQTPQQVTTNVNSEADQQVLSTQCPVNGTQNLFCPIYGHPVLGPWYFSQSTLAALPLMPVQPALSPSGGQVFVSFSYEQYMICARAIATLTEFVAREVPLPCGVLGSVRSIVPHLINALTALDRLFECIRDWQGADHTFRHANWAPVDDLLARIPTARNGLMLGLRANPGGPVQAFELTTSAQGMVYSTPASPDAPLAGERPTSHYMYLRGELLTWPATNL